MRCATFLTALSTTLLPVVALSLASTAVADEIRMRDAQTCAPTTLKVAEIVSETWVEVTARSRPRGPVDKKVPARLIQEIVREEDDPQTARFAEALGDLRRGRFAAARDTFASVAGGGPKIDEAGTKTFVPFNSSDAGGKPKWHAEYAHYYYAEAAWRDALSRGRDKETLEHALRALVADTPAPKEGVAEKGFLARFREGKSRFYGDAMLLRARVLQDLGRLDEASKAYDELYEKAIAIPVGARLAFEAKVGAGRVAEAKGSAADAETAYEAAAAAIEQLIATAPDPCTRKDYGRYFNEAGMQKARVLLEAAEKASSGPAFARLQEYLQSRTPQALAVRLRGRTPEVVSAVVDGAAVPSVQAVLQNGMGLSLLAQGKHTEAVLAFTDVRVRHFSVTEEVPRALHYLARAADAAAKASAGEAKALFERQAAGARRELEVEHPDSPWAKKK